ncbi:hypothetical protein LWI28_020420 [Acer negundo]|uniref:Cytochrome P450 n=1 Tax=Acer negundo TaxID=4023 RepID=A0AAD5J075_ACENE|nr:hypothetical protein LWI28_020420 [Acer negundo]
MELEFSSSSIFFTFVLFLFLVLNIRKRSNNNGRTINLPPGPWKLPIIGNLHHLTGSLPHHRLRDLTGKYGPLMHLQIGELSTVVVSSAEFAKEVMKTHDVIFASRPNVLAANIMGYNSTDIAFAPYGEYWRQLRKICTIELLSMKRVQSYRSIREEEMSNVINWIASRAGSPVNLTQKIHALSYSVTTRAAFGKKCKDQEKYLSLLEESLKLGGGFHIADLFPSVEGFLQWITGIKSKLEKMHKEADQIVENIINEHRRDNEATLMEHGMHEKNEDLVDVLLKVQEDGDAGFRLTTNNIKAVIWDTSSLISHSHLSSLLSPSRRRRQITPSLLVSPSPRYSRRRQLPCLFACFLLTIESPRSYFRISYSSTVTDYQIQTHLYLLI